MTLENIFIAPVEPGSFPDILINWDELLSVCSAHAIAIDCETNTQNPIAKGQPGHTIKDYGLTYLAEVIAVSFSSSAGSTAVYSKSGVYPPEFGEFLATLFRNKLCIFHNSVFDIRQLSKITGGVTPDNLWDTLTIERLLAPETDKSYTLVAVAHSHGIAVSEFQIEMKSKRGTLNKVDIPTMLRYAIADADLTLAVYEAQQELIKDEKDFGLVEWENRANRVYGQMTARGVRLNIPYVKARIIELKELLRETSALFYSNTGKPDTDMLTGLGVKSVFNPGSPTQRVNYVYKTLGYPEPDKNNPDHADLFTAKGGYSTGADALEKLIELYPDRAESLYPLITWLEGDRMIATLESLLDHAALDGRIHSLIAPTTETGRRSSSQPNIQNLAMSAKPGTEKIGTMAGVLIADDDESSNIEVDHNGAESRTAGSIAGDDALATALMSKDFHSSMAAIYFPDQWQAEEKIRPANVKRTEVQDQLRTLGKGVTFGTAYGMGAATLARRLGITLAQAQKILDEKDRVFWAVAETKIAARQKAECLGYVNLWTGRKVPVDPAKSYTAWNYLNQGAVGELIKRAIVLITEEYENRGMRSRICIDMHDALIISVHPDELRAAIGIASWIMETTMPDDYNNNCNPPMVWVAQPDPEKNCKKWGYKQPDILKNWIKPDPVQAAPVTMVASATTESLELPQGATQVNHIVEIPEIEFSYTLPDNGNIRDLYCALLSKVDDLWGPYETRIPFVIADGSIQDKPVSLMLGQWVKVPALWYQVANQCDVQAFTGLTAEELMSEFSYRVQRAEYLNHLVDFCNRKLSGNVQKSTGK